MSKFFDNLEGNLTSLGLSGKLGRFYMAALKLGSAPVQQVAREAGIGRTTAYSLLEKLKDDKLVTLVQKGGKTHMVAENPDVLARNLEDKQRALSAMLPDLRSLYDNGESTPRFQIYDGVDGISTVLNTVLASETEVVRGILSMQELLSSPGREVIDRFVAQRVSAGKWLHVLRSKAEETDDIWHDSDEEMRRVRYTSAAEPFVMTLLLFDNKVGLISSRKENYGLIVESSEFAKVLNALFEVMWQASA